MHQEFESFGKPVPDFRRDEAYRQAREDMGLTSEAAMEAVGRIARAVEDDQPMRAIHGDLPVDITGRYRLLAVLCTGEP